MIIYKDAIGDSHDELMSDSYPMKEVNDILYEVDCKMITIDAIDVDIGANASAEGGDEDEGTADEAVKVNNVVHSFRLQETSFDFKSYAGHLKDYFKGINKRLKEKGASDEDIKAWQEKAKAFTMKVKANFKDYEFFTGESMDINGMVVLMNYREDGITPYVIIWKDGLEEMKV
ncbi:translationally-controlled tumor protein [Xylariomycetidae sp. FL0641]|nr:translationally-controlled tumor protein [Xylariomycetidae sp. FL0641]